MLQHMNNQQQAKSLLDPYRTIGCFTSGKLTLSQSNPISFTAPTGTSFKVYSQNLAIKVASPSFEQAITAAVSYNEYTYIRAAKRVIKMKYHHIVKQWVIDGDGKETNILKFQSMIILNEGNELILIDEDSDAIEVQAYQFKIKGVVHPVTYVNKFIIYGEENFILVNAISNKTLYEYSKLIDSCKANQHKITVSQATPLIDIVGLGFDSGIISFLNLKKDQIVFSVKQKLPVTSLTFSSQQSWMASGDTNGNVLLWDLENKRILYKQEQCLKGQIDSLIFVPGASVVTCASSTANSIKQLKINLDDNKILSLYRQRIGSKLALQSLMIANNNELILSTQSESMFMSLNSQCNNYLLPRVLDSKLPYHLIARHFNVQLYKNNSFQKSFPIHQYPITAQISLSNKYYLVATKRKLIKLGASITLQWKIANIKKIILFNEHSIFAITPNEMVVCDFNTETIIFQMTTEISTPTTNIANNLLAFHNKLQKRIEIWDMAKISQGRLFDISDQTETLCLSFTAQNRFLVSSHVGGKLNIWSVINNEIYKTFDLEGETDMIYHRFTPDNQFMVSIFRGKHEANIWNNYIGRITSNRAEQSLSFKPEIRRLAQDYRLQLQSGDKKQLSIDESQQDILDSIPDADDGVLNYNFEEINKWMPLVYYDEIKMRNAPTSSSQIPSMPFFLDFKNLTEQKKKIEQQIQNDIKEKRKLYREQKDKHLKIKNRELYLNQSSTDLQKIEAFQFLCGLSVAEVDYQLRSFLITPTNSPHLLTMMVAVFKDKSHNSSQQLKNIILNRIINLIGSDLLNQQEVDQCRRLRLSVQDTLLYMKQLVDRSIAIANKHQ